MRLHANDAQPKMVRDSVAVRGDHMTVQYNAPATLRPDEISMWPAELQSETLPLVCAKTGLPAARYYTLNFVASDARVLAFFLGPNLMPGIRAQLPLAGMQVAQLAGLVLARTLAILGATACFLSAFYVPGAPRPLLIVAGLCLSAVGYSSYLLYFFKSQFGDVHRLAAGEPWVRLRRVHPNFVAAVQRWRTLRDAALRDPSLYSANLRWQWNGTQWVSTMPAEPSGAAASTFGRPIAWWQAAAGMLILWTLLGGLAWWRFHG